MHDTVKVSVLVRSFNNEATVAAALSSALNQDFPRREYEIIAVDDGSTDRTARQLQSFASSVSVQLEPHRGNIDAAYSALARVRGKYFALLDADDTYEPNFLSEMTRALEVKPDAAFAYCDYYELSAQSTRTVAVDRKIIKLVACNCMFNREIAVREGFWPKNLLLPELSLAVELSRRYDVVYVPKPLYRYHRHSASMTHQSGFFEKAIAQLEQKYRALLAGRAFSEFTIDECRAAVDQIE